MKRKGESVKGKVFLIIFLLITYHLSLITPAYAAVDIGQKFGFGDYKSLGDFISKMVVPAFSIAAAAVILYFLFGAFKFIQSRGNKEEVAAAQNIIIHAVIGFIILMFAFLILQFLLSSLFGVTGFQII